MLGAYSGLRLGDAASVQWENVDLAAGVLSIIPQKTSRKGKVLRVPLHRRLRKHLEALASEDRAQRSKFLCPSIAERDIGGRAGLSEEFKGIMSAANVEDGMNDAKDGRKRRFSKKSFHSLRHFHVSALANAGVSEDARARLVGHADPKETARYSHLEIKTLRKAVNLVGGKK
jgi:integrase